MTPERTTLVPLTWQELNEMEHILRIHARALRSNGQHAKLLLGMTAKLKAYRDVLGKDS